MAQLADVIQQIATQALSGNNDIAENIKDKVLGGISDSIIDSVKQTAQSKNGLDMLTNLVAGKGDTASIANQLGALAGQIFTSSTANKLGLSSQTTNAITVLLPSIINTLINSKGKINLSEILSIATGLAATSGKKGGLASVAASIFGKMFSKK